MTYPEGYPRLTFKFKKDENGKVVCDENGKPERIYMIWDKDGYTEVTREQVEQLMGALEDGKTER